jgi:hypothetical protein
MPSRSSGTTGNRIETIAHMEQRTAMTATALGTTQPEATERNTKRSTKRDSDHVANDGPWEVGTIACTRRRSRATHTRPFERSDWSNRLRQHRNARSPRATASGRHADVSRIANSEPRSMQPDNYRVGHAETVLWSGFRWGPTGFVIGGVKEHTII